MVRTKRKDSFDQLGTISRGRGGLSYWNIVFKDTSLIVVFILNFLNTRKYSTRQTRDLPKAKLAKNIIDKNRKYIKERSG